MQIILEGDPAFKRVVMKSSFGANEIKNNVADTDDGIMDNNGEENSKYKFIKVVNSSSKPEIQKKEDERIWTERDNEFLRRWTKCKKKSMLS